MPLVQWPDQRPTQPVLYLWPYSLRMAIEGFQLLLPRNASLYVELGTYTGASAQAAAQIAPHARIFCVDTWDGRASSAYVHAAAPLLDLAQANLWPFRHRVDLFQGTTTEGLEYLARLHAKPALIYIDADHSFEGLLRDLSLAVRLFPDAVICGDDFREEEWRDGVCTNTVRKAVKQVLKANYGVIGESFWWRINRESDNDLYIREMGGVE